MKKLLALGLALCGLSSAYAKDPVVIYHTQPIWNGYPTNKTRTGWSAVSLSPDQPGANTGVLAFVMKWDSKKQCWGMDRDCCSPAWAVSQNMSYIGEIQANYFQVDIRQ